MNHIFSERAEASVERYGYFLNILRSQADIVFRRGPTDGQAREEALSVALEAARSFLGVEQGQLNDDTADVARDAYRAALSDLGLSHDDFEGLNRFAEFIFAGASYTGRILAGQAERDVMTMGQHILNVAQRVDLYARSGRHSLSSAAAAVMFEDSQVPNFRFTDRLGRRFKATKHVRDLYRQHLLNIYNEVYMDVVADHGWEIVRVTHPDPGFKWHGAALAIVGDDDEFPLYYDVREEIFHPSSVATLTINFPGDE
jgi:hypothetical protein